MAARDSLTTHDGIARALDHHQAAGRVTAWSHSWDDTRPRGKRNRWLLQLPEVAPLSVDLDGIHAVCAVLASVDLTQQRTTTPPPTLENT